MRMERERERKRERERWILKVLPSREVLNDRSNDELDI
jgi:hypothetical protein